MNVSKISNHPSWNKFETMLKISKNRKIFVKQGVFSFTFFDNFIDGHIHRVKCFEVKNGREGELKTIHIDEHVNGRMNRLKRRADDLGISSLEKKTKLIVNFEEFAYKE